MLSPALTLVVQLQLGPNERDIAHIRVDVRGTIKDERKRLVFEVIDYRDLQTGFTAMSRSVAFAASSAVHLVLDGTISNRGILSPARDVPFQPFLSQLEARGIKISRSVMAWPS